MMGFFLPMSNITNELRGNFSQIPNALIFDSSISDRARFVYCYMASKPDSWVFLIKPMANELGYSPDTLRKYISELIKSGWLVRGAQYNNGGKFGAYNYTIKAQGSKFTASENFRHGKFPIRKKSDTNKYRYNNNTISLNNKERGEFDNSRPPHPDLEEVDFETSTNTPPVAAAPPEDSRYKNFKEWLVNNAPRVAQMKVPITEGQYFDLLRKYGTRIEELKSTLKAMDNYEPLKKRRSAYTTLLQWMDTNHTTTVKGFEGRPIPKYTAAQRAEDRKKWEEAERNAVTREEARIIEEKKKKK